MKKLVLVILTLTLIGASAYSEGVESQAKMVTVFASGAQVTRQKTVQVSAGQSAVTFTSLSPYIDANSIQVKAKGRVTILSVNHQKNFISKAQRDRQIEELNNQKQQFEDKISSVKAKIEVVDDEIAFIKANNVLTSKEQTASFAVIRQTNDYYRERLTSLRQSKIELNRSVNDLQKQKQAIDKQINELNGQKRDEATGEITVGLSASAPASVAFTVSYFVRNAGWRPAYDIRAEQLGDKIQLVCKAEVSQNTRENWENVSLTLSSADPNEGGTAPELKPYVIKDPGHHVVMRRAKPMMFMSAAKSASVNDAGLEAVAYEEEASVPEVSQSESFTSKEFAIRHPYTLRSGKQPSAVELETYSLDADYQYFAAPKLDRSAFLIAKVTDYARLNLLNGNANIYFENTFVGKTYIDGNQTTDTLRLSLGRDRSIAVTRVEEKDFTSSKFIGSKKVVQRGWKIDVRNNKSREISLALHDQVPVSGQSDVEVSVDEISGAQKNDKTGELTWKFNLKPDESKTVRTEYKVKFPKDKDFRIE